MTNSADKINGILNKLLLLKTKPIGVSAGITASEIMTLCKCVQEIFSQQPMILELNGPVYICGDTHGQYHDVLRIFELLNYPPQANYLFLGDYIDRGRQSLENICLLFAYKVKYPENFFLLRGNHECEWVNKSYGFYSELQEHNRELTDTTRIYNLFRDAFKYMPVASIVGDKIFCVHGGLSPDLTSLDDIKAIKRPLEVPHEGLLCDLLWSDPNGDPSAPPYVPGSRGLGYKYSLEAVKDFLDNFGFELLVRAHQPPVNGFEYPFLVSDCAVTIFSVPKYCYQGENKGAVMHVDEDLNVTFYQLDPVDWDWAEGMKVIARLPVSGSADYG